MRTQVWLVLEFAALFLGLPLIYASGVIPGPKIPILLAVFVVALIYLLRSQNFPRRELLHPLRGHGAQLRHIGLRSLLVAVGCVAVVLLIDPSLLFAFPRQRPLLWALVMVLYPLLSAYPQELIYRSFLFERYRPIMPSTSVLLWTSTFAFSFLHIIFGNWVAVVLTLPAGYLFGRTYIQSRSLLLAAVEHALYGCILFTSGLGRFFYTPS